MNRRFTLSINRNTMQYLTQQKMSYFQLRILNIVDMLDFVEQNVEQNFVEHHVEQKIFNSPRQKFGIVLICLKVHVIPNC